MRIILKDGWLLIQLKNKVLCILCNKAITCCKSKLLKPSKSIKHIERALNISKENINDSNDKDTLSHNNKITSQNTVNGCIIYV